MTNLQALVQSYLTSAGFNLPDVRTGFLVADRLGVGGERDTRLFWVAPPPVEVRDFRQLEARLLDEFGILIPQYAAARPFLLVETPEGLSREFLADARRLGVTIRVPAHFFDTPFKHEEAPDATTTVKKLGSEALPKRVPQPFMTVQDGHESGPGEDLFTELLGQYRQPRRGVAGTAALTVVVGAAGAGKTVLFRALFSRLYQHFQQEKKAQRVFPRPIPLVPEFLRPAANLRTQALIENLMRTEIAAQVPRETFEWMLVNGFSMWLFDGVDELYSGDPDFFDGTLDLLTRSGSQAQILICARSSLLTGSEGFRQLLEDFPPSTDGPIRVYKLKEWEHASKRSFAWLRLEGRLPAPVEQDDPPRVAQVLSAISQSPSLKRLSSLPYYCQVLVDEFGEGTLQDHPDDATLIAKVIARMIERERAKGYLPEHHFDVGGLDDWLETVAADAYSNGFNAVAVADLEEYANYVLRAELSDEERRATVTALLLFPLLAPGLRAGTVNFTHELLGEYLAGRHLLKLLPRNPGMVARGLGERIDLGESLIMRLMASKLLSTPGGWDVLYAALQREPLPGRMYGNLLQLAVMGSPSPGFLKKSGLQLEGRDLSFVHFVNLDLEGVSFRNCDLSNSLFRGCNLKRTMFEGAILAGTRFEGILEGLLERAQFGGLERADYIYAGRQRLDERRAIREWVTKATGLTKEVEEPCPAALQARALLLKFVYPDGTGRRDELHLDALSRGKRYPGAPDPQDCVTACQRFGYLERPDWRGRVHRVPGEKYNDLVYFVRDWTLSTEFRQLLNSLCRSTGCTHVPAGFGTSPLGRA